MQVEQLENTQQLNVLIADDHLINQLYIQAILNGAGHACCVAHNGLEVLNLLEERPYDVVLMDNNMPLMDGYEATKEIRKLEQHTGQRKHIIAVTANTGEEHESLCFAAGMDDYLSKPINPKLLLQKIEVLSINKSSTDNQALKYEKQAQLNMDKDKKIQVNQALALVNAEDLKKILSMLLDFVPLAYEQLNQAYHEDNPIKIAQVAHNIAGTTSIVDAGALFNAAIELENTARHGDLEQVEKMITDIKLLMDAYINELNQLISAL